MTDFSSLLQILHEHQVRYILIGGAAGLVHGASRMTQDLDVVYSRDRDNLVALARAVAPLHPYLRGMPPGLPFVFDAATLGHGMNFTLVTSLGDLDLLGQVTGGGGYDDLLPATVEITVFGVPVRCVSLDKLVELKRAVGRPKDLEALTELEELRRRR